MKKLKIVMHGNIPWIVDKDNNHVAHMCNQFERVPGTEEYEALKPQIMATRLERAKQAKIMVNLYNDYLNQQNKKRKR